MNGSNKKLRLIEIICAKVLARVIDSKFNQLCCGCKEYDQDCLMLEEFERWRMYGLDAMEETRHTVWLEVSNVLKILDFPFEKPLIDHLSSLQKSPDLMLMESLLQVYEDNQPLVKVLSDLSDWDPQIDPLANFALCYFSLPHSFEYYVKGTDETFRSHEKDHRKAYHNYLKDKLQEHFNNL